MLLTILAMVPIAFAAVLLIAARMPDHFRIERSVQIEAPPTRIFALINDLHAWSQWSPWEKLDPGMRREFSGPESGKGAAYSWAGSAKAGAGRMEIIDSVPHERISIKLDFLKPFEAHNTAEFTLAPAGDATQVSWAMYGPSPLMARVMQLFFSMGKMVGKDFEAGLSNLRSLARQ